MMNRLVIPTLLLAACSWWAACTQQPAPAQAGLMPEAALQAGDSIAMQAQKTLVGALMKQLNEQGSTAALSFCNVHAIPLTDSLSRRFKCHIQRISEKNRNPDNAPATDQDRAVLQQYSEQHGAGQPLKSVVKTEQGKPVCYKPIMVAMPACLQCHGTPGADISSETAQLLGEKYPADRATGYKQGDFRGAWKITF